MPPELKCLDIAFCNPCISDGLFSQLSKFTNLQSLGLCLPRTWSSIWHRDAALVRWPDLKTAHERGVKLNVVSDPEDLVDVFLNPTIVKSAWARHA